MTIEGRVNKRFVDVVRSNVADSPKPTGVNEVGLVQQRATKDVDDHRITHSIFEPSERGKKIMEMGMQVPAYAIEVFTHVPGSEPNLKTRFDLREEGNTDSVWRTHWVGVERSTIPFTHELNSKQAEAFMEFAEDPHAQDRDKKLAVARALTREDQDIARQSLLRAERNAQEHLAWIRQRNQRGGLDQRAWVWRRQSD